MASLHTSDQARRRLKRRYAAETRFRLFGLVALMIAFGFLLFFLASIIRQAYPAFFQHYLMLEIDLSKSGPGAAPLLTKESVAKADFDGLLREKLRELFPSAVSKPDRRSVNMLVSAGGPVVLRKDVASHPDWIGTRQVYPVLLDDGIDLYLKNGNESRAVSGKGALSLFAIGEDKVDLISTHADDFNFPNPPPALSAKDPSYLVKINGGVIKLISITPPKLTGQVILPPVTLQTAQAGQWQVVMIDTPEASRKLSDRSIILIESLKERGLIEKRISNEFFTLGASREAEMAGIFSALVGSILTLLITLLISFPVSVGAAIYLEEFAPKTRLTETIEVNINNLAAVPSIIFGLLGLAVFINIFGMPRSAPFVGGLVLALMTMPIIIIASRAALRSVPPSVKEAALGIGASHMQAVFHHILPLAIPGILTGTILGTARALGETAPLLLIGMVAFVVDAPTGMFDAATLLPVQIFMWNDFPEIAFQHKTAAAILVLLIFLAVMNLAAVLVRRRFEQRW